ncbi:type II toxin-antitoxin system HicA family toxin [Devosia neptuniae]|uniref:type II toxin-antitoxin system HicA family toxin n=1 Tax=Devosia neptuniae TaxID=191302 RepID=UPI0029056F7D|nr:type II toxin-antitoxin system HicA family toxin [Devosia neptuniae]
MVARQPRHCSPVDCGWLLLVSTRGSHHKYRHPASGRTVILPHPRKDIPAGTVRSIYRQAGWSENDDA